MRLRSESPIFWMGYKKKGMPEAQDKPQARGKPQAQDKPQAQGKPEWMPIGKYRNVPLPLRPILPPVKWVPWEQIKESLYTKKIPATP